MSVLSPASAFFEAVVLRLKADAACAALFADRIYDEPPADGGPRLETPFVHLGPCGMRRDTETGCNITWRFGLRLYVTSTRAGRVEAWDCCHAVFDALHQWKPDLSAFGWHVPRLVEAELGGDAINPIAVKQCFVDIIAYVQKP